MEGRTISGGEKDYGRVLIEGEEDQSKGFSEGGQYTLLLLY